jgi:hypothetical protein
MSETNQADPTPASAPAPTPARAQAPAPAPTAADPSDKPEPTEPKIRDPNDAIRQLRKENEKLRKTLDEQAAERAEKMSDEKLETLRKDTEEKATAKAEKMIDKRLAEMEEAARARVAKSELKGFALRAGVIDFDDVYEILKRGDLQKIEFDEDGEVENAGQIIADLKQKKPHLFAGVNTSSTERAHHGKSQPPADDKPALRMSKEEFERGRRALSRM